MASPDFQQRARKDVGARVIAAPAPAGETAGDHVVTSSSRSGAGA
ncbi:hypothetical protein ACU4GD_37205 [Cupriavidus basilensis]